MTLIQLTFIGGLTFFIIIGLFLFTFKKSSEKVLLWIPLIAFFFVIILLSWWMTDLALQWVLVEATTLFGALLISLSRTEKSIDTAWKFLLLNSFGLGLAFIGILLVSFGTSDPASDGLKSFEIIQRIHSHENLIVEAGIWLAVFGYSAKLGLFPNHFWVSDTYAESPSQISALLAAFLPVTVIFAILPFIEMDRHYESLHFNASTGFMGFGLITMVYSLFTMVQTNDIRRLTALIAMFHSGGLAILIYLRPPDTVIYYALASNIIIKALLFSCMGILRIDMGSRLINDLENIKSIQKITLILFTFGLGMSFVLPFSPFFIFDLILVKNAMILKKYYLIIVPILSILGFIVSLSKILPLFSLENRDFKLEDKSVLSLRIKLTYILIFSSITVGLFGLMKLSLGEM